MINAFINIFHIINSILMEQIEHMRPPIKWPVQFSDNTPYIWWSERAKRKPMTVFKRFRLVEVGNRPPIAKAGAARLHVLIFRIIWPDILLEFNSVEIKNNLTEKTCFSIGM